MVLRIKFRREFKLALEEDGYSQEEIKEQLGQLINEEIEKRDLYNCSLDHQTSQREKVTK